MTLLKPTLSIRRLAVFKGGSAAFDEHFHDGVNVICGENSSGKSSVLDLLFFSLGGHITHWKTEAARCDSTLVEVAINDSPVVLRRKIDRHGQSGMDVFWGEFSDAESRSSEGWQRFPYRRTKDLESFSQVLFRALGLPQVHGDRDANITMHQILRVIVADQMTPHGAIFRFERFDSSLTREAVGNLLLGVYDDDLYEAELSLSTCEKQFDENSKRLKAIYQVFGDAEENITIEWLEQNILNLESERDALYKEIEKVRNSRWEDGSQNERPTPSLQELYSSLRQLNKRVGELERDYEQVQFELSDSDQFVASLKQRLNELDTSDSVQGQLGQMIFTYCPSCFSPVSEKGNNESCRLCGSTIEGRSMRSQFARMRNEIELQISESEEIMAKSAERLKDITRTLPGIREERDALYKRYNSKSANLTSAKDVRIEEITRRLGYIDAELSSLQGKRKLFGQIRELVDSKAELQARISKLRDIIDAGKIRQSRLREKSYESVARATAKYLAMDLEREDAFFRRDLEVDFDFNKDSIFVADQQSLSASSMVYLRNAFHLALLFSSSVEEHMRYPRLMILDGIDDGGMEVERNHNFQRIVLDESVALQSQHQIVLATAMPAPELRDSDLVIGRYYTHDSKTLTV